MTMPQCIWDMYVKDPSQAMTFEEFLKMDLHVNRGLGYVENPEENAERRKRLMDNDYAYLAQRDK
jgi:hypothetical protein